MSETLVNAIFTPVGVIGGITAVAIVIATLIQRRQISSWYTYVLVVLFGPTCFLPFWHWSTAVAVSLTVFVAVVGVAVGAIIARGSNQRPQAKQA